jgi:adenosylmethionine-8-amino-7-oxononanoate aminotransferase
LAEITPGGLERFFFTVGGSDAVDTAIKLVRHANILAGKPEKMTVIARRDGYHGMTMGGTTATGIAVFRTSIGPLLPGVVHVGQPGRWGDGATAADLEQRILELGPENVAAFIGEPVSLPPGLAIPPDDYWPGIREVCTRYEVRVIADEVINGFGRTGRMFACDHWGLEPDLMTMSKGITSGYVPLGAVGLREELYQTLLGSTGILPHGFTAGGHPVACAVALANIELRDRRSAGANGSQRSRPHRITRPARCSRRGAPRVRRQLDRLRHKSKTTGRTGSRVASSRARATEPTSPSRTSWSILEHLPFREVPCDAQSVCSGQTETRARTLGTGLGGRLWVARALAVLR